MVWRELEEGLRGQGWTCQCGQGEHTEDPDLGQSADLIAGMVARLVQSPHHRMREILFWKRL